MSKRDVQINVKLVAKALVALIIILLILNWVFATGVFSNRGFITISFSKFSDLLSAENTQGRSMIWTYLINELYAEGALSQVFGIDLVSDQVFLNGATYGSHSLYVGLLYNVGIAGLLCFVAFVVSVFLKICSLQNATERRKSFFMLAIMAMFIISGISVHVLQYTANSWIPMLMFGIAVTGNNAAASVSVREKA